LYFLKSPRAFGPVARRSQERVTPGFLPFAPSGPPSRTARAFKFVPDKFVSHSATSPVAGIVSPCKAGNTGAQKSLAKARFSHSPQSETV